MTLVELLNIANKGYPDGYLAELYDPETGDPVPDADEKGDTLALCILRDLRDTFVPDSTREEQFTEAIRIMKVVRDDVQGVLHALYQSEWAEVTP